jgi:hypothetical protein
MTPASPKVHKAKDPEPGVPLYGCGTSIFNGAIKGQDANRSQSMSNGS